VRPLAPSRVDACNPLLQAHPTWAWDKHEGRGIPPLTPVSLRLPPPFALCLAPTHLGWGTRRQFTRQSRDAPGLETPTLLHVYEDVSHHARTIVFAVVGRPVRLPGLRPVLPPQPTASAHGRSYEPTDAHRRGYGASRSCSWPFSMLAVEEDMVARATLRLSWR
jgi:hypothetical protein